MKAFRSVGIFCFVGAACALYAAITLAWPGTALDGLWRINPNGHAQLLPLGPLIGIAFLCLAILMVVLGWAWLRRRSFAWYGVVIGLAVNMLGDASQVFVGRWREGLVGVVIAGLILRYLVHPTTRQHFRDSPPPHDGNPS